MKCPVCGDEVKQGVCPFCGWRADGGKQQQTQRPDTAPKVNVEHRPLDEGPAAVRQQRVYTEEEKAKLREMAQARQERLQKMQRQSGPAPQQQVQVPPAYQYPYPYPYPYPAYCPPPGSVQPVQQRGTGPPAGGREKKRRRREGRKMGLKGIFKLIAVLWLLGLLGSMGQALFGGSAGDGSGSASTSVSVSAPAAEGSAAAP